MSMTCTSLTVFQNFTQLWYLFMYHPRQLSLAHHFTHNRNRNILIEIFGSLFPTQHSNNKLQDTDNIMAGWKP